MSDTIPISTGPPPPFPQPPLRWWQRFLAAPSALEIAVYYVWFGSYLVLATDATIHEPAVNPNSQLYTLVFLWETLPVFVLAMIVVRALLIVPLKLLPAARTQIRRWVLLTFMGLGLVLVTNTNLDLALRLWLSESDLLDSVALIHTWPADQVTSDRDFSAGFFTVHHVHRDGRIIWFQTVVYGPPFSAGLVYSSNGPPPAFGASLYEHLYGPWWRWLQNL